MRVGILQAGAPPRDLRTRFPGYGDMVMDLLGAGFEGRVYEVCAGELPQAPRDGDAWIITGSPAGVYDPLPWIAPLERFILEASGQAPMIGICFGHQLMAQAFGGRVIKSPKGWGIGLHRYDLHSPAAWMDASPDPVRLAVSHQDQVVGVGPGCTVIGASAFTPFAMLAYIERRAVSLQAHPEFAPDYATALIAARRGDTLEAAAADAAIASLQGPNDRSRVAGWLRRFLTTA
jgi:GMP synthase-like glutamine amidotransferase